MKHPKGLYVLFATEFWERFSYYGMRAIFILYMTKMLFNGDKALSSNIYGSYTGLVYLTPLIGGYVADRYWGNRKSIFVGGIMMAIGQFFMFLSASSVANNSLAVSLMWGGLAFLIFGNGFFKPNISTMVGQLYEDTDSRKDAAYTIFYMGINAGAFLSPLVCGYLGEKVDFKWGFLAAGIGMIIALIIFYFTKDKYVISPSGEQLGVLPNKVRDNDAGSNNEGGSFSTQQLGILFGGIAVMFSLIYFYFGVDLWGSLIYSMTVVAPFVIITDKTLSKVEKERLWVIITLMIFVVFFWMCFEQAGASLTFFAEEQTNRNILGWVMPASYFQSFNAGFIILLAPILTMFWAWLNKKGMEPASPRKMSIGLAFLAAGFLFISMGAKSIPAGGASIIFLTGLYFLHTIGELWLSPIGLSMVNKLTPARFTSLMMGVWFLAIATGNKLAGLFSSLYPDAKTNYYPTLLGIQISDLYTYFIVFVCFSGVAALIVFLLSKKLENMMNGIR
ncbi:MAG: peptide MFS transporter [Saprospiraceae bacterium]|nr:peptide MFS transporter [Saprospiraceae bacterium]